MNRTLVLALGILSAIDLLSTWLGLTMGGQELNPMVRGLLTMGLLPALAGVAAMKGGSIFAVYESMKRLGGTNYGWIALGSALFLVDAFNLAQVLSALH
jgi:hypothetical protein